MNLYLLNMWHQRIHVSRQINVGRCRRYMAFSLIFLIAVAINTSTWVHSVCTSYTLSNSNIQALIPSLLSLYKVLCVTLYYYHYHESVSLLILQSLLLGCFRKLSAFSVMQSQLVGSALLYCQPLLGLYHLSHLFYLLSGLIRLPSLITAFFGSLLSPHTQREDNYSSLVGRNLIKCQFYSFIFTTIMNLASNIE